MRMGIVTERHFVSVRLQGSVDVSSLRLAFLLSSDDPGPWDPRDPVTVELSLCWSTFQDLVESGLSDPEAAFVSKEVLRANILPITCSILVIFVVWASSV